MAAERPGGRRRSQTRFDSAARLRHAADFAAVFAAKRMLRSEHFTLHWRPNGYGRPRLGLVVSKRQAKCAVLRNAIKRQIREAFRVRQHALPAVDLVLRLAKPWPPELARARARSARAAWRGEITALFDQLSAGRTC